MMVVYISTKFHEKILDVIKVMELTQFSKENFKGAEFRKNIAGVMVLFLCTLYDDG